MTLRIQGTEIAPARAKGMTTIERFTPAQLAGRTRYKLERFCLDFAIDAISRANMAFISFPDFLNEVIAQCEAAHNRLDSLKLEWSGRTAGHYIRFGQIAPPQQTAVRNLINNGNPLPGHDRGAHQTSPTAVRRGVAREYDLTAGREGRLTTKNVGGKIAYYYSRHHAAATYEYLLITDANGRPILRGTFAADVMKIPI